MIEQVQFISRSNNTEPHSSLSLQHTSKHVPVLCYFQTALLYRQIKRPSAMFLMTHTNATDTVKGTAQYTRTENVNSLAG